jgi:hypothetical protein
MVEGTNCYTEQHNCHRTITKSQRKRAFCSDQWLVYAAVAILLAILERWHRCIPLMMAINLFPRPCSTFAGNLRDKENFACSKTLYNAIWMCPATRVHLSAWKRRGEAPSSLFSRILLLAHHFSLLDLLLGSLLSQDHLSLKSHASQERHARSPRGDRWRWHVRPYMRTPTKAAGGAYHAIKSMQHCSCTLLMTSSSNYELSNEGKGTPFLLLFRWTA